MKQTFSIPDIHCASCVMLLETLEEDCDCVNEVKVDLIKKEATIDFDPSTVTTDGIIAEIKKVSGYKAVLNVS